MTKEDDAEARGGDEERGGDLALFFVFTFLSKSNVCGFFCPHPPGQVDLTLIHLFKHISCTGLRQQLNFMSLLSLLDLSSKQTQQNSSFSLSLEPPL
jgi:hypothetical protein